METWEIFIVGYGVGAGITCLVCLFIYGKLKEMWIAEFARLNWGIKKVMHDVLNINTPRSLIYTYLRKLHEGGE